MTAHTDLGAVRGPRGEVRDRALRHLRGCAECRARLAQDDPSALFALLADRPVPQAVSEGVARAVFAEAGRAGAAGMAPTWGGRAPRYAAAASILLAAALGALALRHAPSPAARATSGPAPRASVSVVSRQAPAQVVDLTVGDTQVVMIFDPKAAL